HRPRPERGAARLRRGDPPLRRLHHLLDPVRDRPALGRVRPAKAGMARQDRGHSRHPPGGDVTAGDIPPDDPGPGAPTPAQPQRAPIGAGTLSPDGHWLWDGTRWIPAPPPP